ncbi:Cytochrome P450 89A9 [Linum grandiflorum]
MELWLIIIAILCIGASLRSLFTSSAAAGKNLPPSPPTLPILGNFLLLLKSSNNFSALKPLLRRLSAEHGPIVTLYLGSRPSIFITSRETAHQALVRSGSTFASRPPALETSRIIFTNQNTLATSPYNPTWRVLRQNFTSLLHPSRLGSYSDCRRWAAQLLKKGIAAEIGGPIQVIDHFYHAFFILLTYMCFGEKLEENLVLDIERTQRATIGNFIRFNVLNFMPGLTKVLYRSLWNELVEIRRRLDVTLLPLIKARQEQMKKNTKNRGETDPGSKWYLDSILELGIPDGDGGRERKFTDEELVSLCSEFLNSGTDTTVTTLQWAMANLVKHPSIQEKLREEIDRVVPPGSEIRDEDLKEMRYLNAVVLETLRRHPPGHFILPRAVTEDTKLGGYDIPRCAIINVTVADMGRDPAVWEDPMEFRPERFLLEGGEGEEFDFKGVKGIKMMPFGAGRRVCPAITVAILHLEWFVVNLVRDFEWWPAAQGEEVDFSEKQDFTTGMKYPLKVTVTPRSNS